MNYCVLTPEQQRQVMDSALQLMSAHDLAEITLEQLTHASGVSAFDMVLPQTIVGVVIVTRSCGMV